MSTLYRGTKLGDSLVEALDVLVEDGKISTNLAVEVLTKFDEAMLRALQRDVNAKASLKGKLDVYRYIDNVWTFILSDVTLRAAPTLTASKKDEQEVVVDGPVKLVLVDAKLVKLPEEETRGDGDVDQS
jgi:transcription initiation factor TFIIA small subunit